MIKQVLFQPLDVPRILIIFIWNFYLKWEYSDLYVFLHFFYLIFSGINAYIKNKSATLLASLLFFLSMLLPLPAGSFFTSFGATIFWVNVGVIYYKINNRDD